MKFEQCHDSRPCFAKFFNGKTNERGEKVMMCNVIVNTYKTIVGPGGINYRIRPYADGECPFCKPERLVTDGVVYPDNPPVGS